MSVESHLPDNPQFQNLTDDGKIMKKTLKIGVGFPPVQNQEVIFQVMLNDEKENTVSGSESFPFKAAIGQNNVNYTLETALKTMLIGERAIVKNETQTYEIEIIRFGNTNKNQWDLEENERESFANLQKEEGNKAIKQQQNEISFQRYENAFKVIIDDTGSKFDTLKSQLLANLSLASLKIKNYEKCLEYAGKVLAEDPNNIKVLMRRASAYAGQNKFSEAKNDLNQALKVEPNNQQILQEMQNIKKQEEISIQKEKQIYSKMFGNN